MLEKGIAMEGAGSSVGESAPQGGSSGAPAGGLDWGVFKESLGDLGKDKSFEPIKDFNGLAKSYVDAQKMIGGSIRLPKKDAPPEVRQKAVGDILGKLRSEGILESPPESPDKYEIKYPTEEGFKPNEPLVASFKAAAHKMGVLPSQVQGMFDWYLNFQAETQAEEQREFEETKVNLKKEMGGLYVRKMEAARRAVSKYIGEDGDELISNLPPQSAARILKAFAEIGDPMLEEAMVAGEIPGVVTQAELETKIINMISEKGNALNNLTDPRHKAAVDEYTKLQQDLLRFQSRKGGR